MILNSFMAHLLKMRAHTHLPMKMMMTIYLKTGSVLHTILTENLGLSLPYLYIFFLARVDGIWVSLRAE